MRLTLLHTAPVHEATFDTLRDRIAPGVPLTHVTRPDWLESARAEGLTASLEADLAAAIGGSAGPVLCTCTTLGPLAERLGALRIDVPMMREAARIGGPVTMAYALTSTAEASRALFEREAPGVPLRLLDLSAFWPLFEAGEITAFHAALAAGIRDDLTDHPARVVLLAQASMAGAAAMLEGPWTVLTSPESALRAALDHAGTTG